MELGSAIHQTPSHHTPSPVVRATARGTEDFLEKRKRKWHELEERGFELGLRRGQEGARMEPQAEKGRTKGRAVGEKSAD